MSNFVENQGIFIKASRWDRCWICDSDTGLSGEHKIKAADIRREFDGASMVIGRLDDPGCSFRHVQGPRSKRLKFDSKVCHICNTSTTQDSDLAYDQFVSIVEKLVANGQSVQCVFEDERFLETGALFIPLMRYFAKLMGCHLADMSLPIPAQLVQFVAKKNDNNRLLLDVRPCYEYEQLQEGREQAERLHYAAHGGLIVVTKEPDYLPVRLHSSVSIGSVQFVYCYWFNDWEISELCSYHPEFISWCQNAADQEIARPMSEQHSYKLGLNNPYRG